MSNFWNISHIEQKKDNKSLHWNIFRNNHLTKGMKNFVDMMAWWKDLNGLFTKNNQEKEEA